MVTARCAQMSATSCQALCSIDGVEEAANAWQGAERAEIPGAGHILHFHALAGLAAVVEAFLS